VVDQSLPGSSAPHDYGDLKSHVDDIAGQADELLSRINAELGAVLKSSSVEIFPGFFTHPNGSGPGTFAPIVRSRTELIERVGGMESSFS